MPKMKTKEQKTERRWVKLVWLFTLCIMMIAVGPACGATTYKLVRVASVSEGNNYVFEQDGYVMKNTINSYALTTTKSYKKTGLSGTESYVWTLESATGGFYMKNASLSSEQYLHVKKDNPQYLLLDSKSYNNKTGIWSFTYQEDGTFHIKSPNFENRILAFTNEHYYKAYAYSNLSTTQHSIVAYQLVEDPQVTVSSSGFATYCCQYPLDLDALDSNVRAYTVKEISGTTVLFKRITGTIASGVPFILYGTPNITCTLPLTTNSENHPEPNLLIGTLTPTFMPQQYAGYTYFALSATYGDFRKLKAEGMTVPANKAILPVPNSLIAEMSEARMAITFDDETTGISSMDNGQSSMDNTVYDLQGRRVDASLHHQPGIYLVRGKKIFVNK